MSYGGYSPEQIDRQLRNDGMQNMIGAGSLGMNVLGTAIQGFGAYQQYKQSERMRKEERRRYEEQKRLEMEDRRKQEEEARQAKLMGFGQYAQSMGDRRNQGYQGYAARVGL